MGDVIDPEAERPRGYVEYVSSDVSWEEVGMRIRWTEPIIPGKVKAFVDSPLRLRVCVETKLDMAIPPEDLTVWCWTPIITKTNPLGIWKEIGLEYNPRCTQWDDHGIKVFVYRGMIQATVGDTYRVTFNMKYKQIMVWSNRFQKDTFANVGLHRSVGTQTHINPMVHFSSNFNQKQEIDDQSTDKSMGLNPKPRPRDTLTGRWY